MINFKLPGKQKHKRILLIILIIISIGILAYEHISHREIKNEKEIEDIEKDEVISSSNEEEVSEETVEISETEEEKNLYDEAYTLFFENNYTKSIEKSNELVNKFPYNPKGYNIRGIAESYNGNYEGGLSDIEKALSIDNSYGYALFNKALTYELYGEYDNALDWYNKALQVEDYVWSYYGIASIYGRKGDTENTVKYLKKAIEMDEAVKEEAKTEKDFDPVRDCDEFKNIINN